MDDEQVTTGLRLMSVATASHITNQIAHDICVRDGATATIDGSIESLGKNYVITLQATTCRGRRDAGSGTDSSGRQKSMCLNALGIAATAMRARLESRSIRIQKLNRPLETSHHSIAGSSPELTPRVIPRWARANFWPLFRRLSAPLHSIQISRWLTSCSASRSTMPGT